MKVTCVKCGFTEDLVNFNSLIRADTHANVITAIVFIECPICMLQSYVNTFDLLPHQVCLRYGKMFVPEDINSMSQSKVYEFINKKMEETRKNYEQKYKE